MHTGCELNTFDRIGNIQNLNRGENDGNGSLLNQTYNYTYDPGTNRLTSAKGNYTYDASGNLRTDDSKGLIATIYGRANLPTTLPLNRASLSKASGLVTRAQQKS